MSRNFFLVQPDAGFNVSEWKRYLANNQFNACRFIVVTPADGLFANGELPAEHHTVFQPDFGLMPNWQSKLVGKVSDQRLALLEPQLVSARRRCIKIELRLHNPKLEKSRVRFNRNPSFEKVAS